MEGLGFFWEGGGGGSRSSTEEKKIRTPRVGVINLRIILQVNHTHNNVPNHPTNNGCESSA